MRDIYGIASFRSRQQVLRLEDELRREGLNVRVVTTPREVALGCGLSVQFDVGDLARVRQVISRVRPTNLIGLYRVENNPSGRPKISVF